jgi:hypothetical protein
MNKYYDKYLKYKKKYLNLRSQLAGTSFATPTKQNNYQFTLSEYLTHGLTTPISTPPRTPTGLTTPPRTPTGLTTPRTPTGLTTPRTPTGLTTPPRTPTGLTTPPKTPTGLTTRIPNSRSKDEINKEIIELINETYPGNWILTGSLAIIKYQKALGISSGLVANDVDILIVCQGRSRLWKIEATEIGDYKKVQKTIEKSVTFKNGNNSFDVTCVGKLPTYNIIDDIRVLSPIILLDYYNFNNRDQDKDKIIMLEQIIKTIEQGYTKFIL